MTGFYLNEEPQVRSIEGWPAHTTVLDYLREQRLTGTKEGCATGDCGTCTAVTVTLDGNKLRYASLDTCIALLPMLADRLLITVDGLSDNGKLHPVQQAMVKHHGSQCGFCTPGFVMSLFAHAKSGGGRERAQIVECFSGNLCRCTGYVPIIAAGQNLSPTASKDKYSKAASQIKQRLRSLACARKGNATLPRTITQLATSLAGKQRRRMIAGGTDLALEITQQLTQPQLTFAGDVTELAVFKAAKDHWLIGAGVTWERLERELSPHLVGFKTLMERFGSKQIRHRGTVGGNLGNASPIADGPPVFLALGATLILRRGTKHREVDLDSFYTGYRRTVLRTGEFIEALKLQRPSRSTWFNVYKISKRLEDDISSVCGAFALKLDRAGIVQHVRCAYGGMAAVPARATRCEAACYGKQWDATTVQQATAALAQDFTPMTDIRASAQYRALVAANLLRRFFLHTQGERVMFDEVLVA